MSVKVKICGITNIDDALLAVESGADALGFVLWKGSPRGIETPALAAITRQVPETVERVGVFVDSPGGEIESIVRDSGLTRVQLHGGQDRTFCHSLSVDWYRAFGIDDSTSQRSLVEEIAGFNAPVYLIDSGTTGAPGGTGQTVDWTLAAKVSIALSLRGRPGMMLAGGLTSDNVANAIRSVRPWWVDVASGVEAEPGLKDPAKVRSFVSAVRTLG